MRTLLLTIGLAMALICTSVAIAEETVPDRSKIRIGDGYGYKVEGRTNQKWKRYGEDGFVWFFTGSSRKRNVITRKKIAPNGDTSPWFVQSILVDGEGWVKIKHVPKGHKVFVEFESGEWLKLTCVQEPRNKRE